MLKTKTSRLTIVIKLWAVVGAALIALIGLGTLASTSLQGVEASGNQLYRETKAAGDLRTQVRVDLEKAMGLINAAPAELDVGRLDRKAEQATSLLDGIAILVDAAASGTDQESVKRSASDVAARINDLNAVATKVFDLVRQFAQQEAAALVESDVLAAQEALLSSVDAFDRATSDRSNAAAEAIQEEAQTVRTVMLAVVAITVVAIGLFSWVTVSRGVVAPITALSRTMLRLADGDLSTDVVEAARGDEIGTMGRAVETFKQNAIERQRLEAEQKAAEAQQAASRRREIAEIADALNTQLGDVVHSLDGMTSKLGSSAGQLSTVSTRNRELAADVASSATQASANVQSVAAAVEQLDNSISEIAQQVGHSRTISLQAGQEAHRARDTMQALLSSADQINTVVELISGIAAQTNLLALNATIEAARAGEAGKGFAVVASEVKSLASQTARATEEISAQIGRLQSASDAAAKDITSVAGIVLRMEEISATIASAVEEQAASAREISRNVQEAAGGTDGVTRSIEAVSSGSDETSGAAGEVADIATRLSGETRDMRAKVQRIVADLRQKAA